MESTYEHGALLSGVIYLQRITDNHVGGSANKTISVFQKLCGKESMNNVLLVSNMWEDVDFTRGTQRESELCDDEAFWSAMIALGARVGRYDNKQSTALGLIEFLLGNNPIPLNIQKQLVDEDKPLINTDAGAQMNAELIKERKKHREELAEFEKQWQIALETGKHDIYTLVV